MRRSTVLMFGSLLAATTVSAQVPTTSKGSKTETSSAPSTPPSTAGKSSGSSVGSSSGSSSMGSSMGSPSWDRIPSGSKGRSVDRTSNWNYDPRSSSDYTRASSKGFDREQEARAKEFRNLRESQLTRDMLDRIRLELLSKPPKTGSDEVLPTTSKVILNKTRPADDPNPPEVPPSPNKPTKERIVPPVDRPGTTVVINRYLDDYYYWWRLNNSFHAYCSEFDRAWGAGFRYGLRPFSIYGGSYSYWGDEFYSFMNRSYSPYGFGLYAGMGMYSPLYSSMYGRMYGGYGYGYGDGGCGRWEGNSLRNDRPNHIDRCALVTVETFGEALYELQVSLPELKVNSAEELEKLLNARLQKNEAIFLTDEDGYELQLTPGTAKRFRVKHCERD